MEECISGNSPEHPSTRLRDQLAVEYQLQRLCRRLLDSYKDQRDWVAVGQVAHSLVTSSQRINVLKEQLLNGDYPIFPRRLLSISEHPFESSLTSDKAGHEPESGEEVSDGETESEGESSEAFDEEADKSRPQCFDSGVQKPIAEVDSVTDNPVGPSQLSRSEGGEAKAADSTTPPPATGDPPGETEDCAESSLQDPPEPSCNTPPLHQASSESEGVSQGAETNLATGQPLKKLPEGEEEDPPSSCDTDLSSSMSEVGGRVGLQSDISTALAVDGGAMEAVSECVEERDSGECAVGEGVETTMADADMGEIANGVEEDEVCSNSSSSGGGGDGEGGGGGGGEGAISEGVGQNGSLSELCFLCTW